MRISLSLVSLLSLGIACSGQESPSSTDTSALTGTSATSSNSVSAPAQVSPTSPATTTPSPTSASPTTPNTSSQTSTSPADTSTDDSGDPSADLSDTSGEQEPAESTGAPMTPAPPAENCTDNPDPEQTCAVRKEWGNCEQQWMIDGDYCNRTCERCGGGEQPNTPSPQQPAEQPTEPAQPNQPTTPVVDNRFPPLTGGGDGFATRYWDCAKPSCGWSANAGGNAVRSCDRNGNSIGVTDERNGLEGGNAFTCFSWAPWAVNDSLAFGFAATHTNSTCGKCYQLTFTGQGQHNAADPGSGAIRNKTMIVMATNIGGDVQGFQLDTLIPGGGVGANNACPNQGVPAPSGDLAYGGFLKKCSGSADLSARKECVRQECNTAYGDPQFADLKEGCLWFVDWYNVADNPKFWSKEVPCPQELSGVAR